MPTPASNHDADAPFVQARTDVEAISAVTLVTADMVRAVRFYEALGFRRLLGGPEASFTSFAVGGNYLNLAAKTTATPLAAWGRVIFYVSDVDTFYNRATGAGLSPQFAPRNAEWGERYFHLSDPDGHELSFARPLRR
ncbi:MAG: VOC family protein [Planctomycetes bacterium]|nr:VOC family protein [Planctomycetota bacterium]